jgi:hypothetical protein
MEYHGLTVRFLAKQTTENDDETRKELKSQGNKGETYNDVINRLLEGTDKKTETEGTDLD